MITHALYDCFSYKIFNANGMSTITSQCKQQYMLIEAFINDKFILALFVIPEFSSNN